MAHAICQNKVTCDSMDCCQPATVRTRIVLPPTEYTNEKNQVRLTKGVIMDLDLCDGCNLRRAREADRLAELEAAAG